MNDRQRQATSKPASSREEAVKISDKNRKASKPKHRRNKAPPPVPFFTVTNRKDGGENGK